MNWVVVNGGSETVILENGTRGDLVEYYSAQLIPLALVIDHEGYVVAKENTGTPLDRWKSFDNAIEKANNCLLYTSPSPRDRSLSRMPSSA